MFQITYYGVRGSIAVSGKDYLKYGGNTTCVQIETDDGIFIIDSGTGIRNLANNLLARKINPLKIHLFYTHTHWDHIQGFPFFTPAYIPGVSLNIYGESKEVLFNNKKTTWNIETILNSQQNFIYFPAPLEGMASTRKYYEIHAKQKIKIGSTIVQTFHQNHPNSSLGFRFEFQDKVFVFASDIEYSKDMHHDFLQFAKGTNVLAFDCQYTPEEYQNGKVGWGHSTYENASWLAKDLQLAELQMIHHDPMHNDYALEEIEKKAKMLFRNSFMVSENHRFSL